MSPEGGKGAFVFCLLGLYFGLFGVGRFWKGKELLKGKIAEGKRTVEGKMLKRKGKNYLRENAKEGLTESLHQER
jgi:hypothetical protein